MSHHEHEHERQRQRQRGRLGLLFVLAVALVAALVVAAPSGLRAGGTPPKKKAEADASAAALPAFEFEMPKKLLREWPPQGWATAKAYTFNMDKAFGPGLRIVAWSNGEWNENIDSTHELDRAQAELALELVHRTRGGVAVSKCAFPRHAVVFFDAEGNPVGSVNVCFECGDIIVSPAYFDDEYEDGSLELAKYEIPGKRKKKTKKKSDDGDEEEDPEPLIYQVYNEAMPHWAEFFTALGVPLEPVREE